MNKGLPRRVSYHAPIAYEVVIKCLQNVSGTKLDLPWCSFKALVNYRTQCCGHIVAHDVSWAGQTGKHLLRTQNISEQNQKHFLCSGHKICVRDKCWARGQTGKHLCRQQCVLVFQGLYSGIGLCFVFSLGMILHDDEFQRKENKG